MSILTIKDSYLGQETSSNILSDSSAFKIEETASTGYTEISKYIHHSILILFFDYTYSEVRNFLACTSAEFNLLNDEEKNIVVGYLSCVDNNGDFDTTPLKGYLTSNGYTTSEADLRIGRCENKLNINVPKTQSLITDTVDIIGKGVGSSKTTTSIHGDTTLSEDFALNNELYLHWVKPSNYDTTQDSTIKVAWFPVVSESGKKLSWELKYTSLTEGDDITTITGTLNSSDEDIPATAFTNTISTFTIPKEDLTNKSGLHFRLKMISSSSDPSDKIAVHHMLIKYYTK